MVFHRILDFKTGLNVYSGPFLFLYCRKFHLKWSRKKTINNGQIHSLQSIASEIHLYQKLIDKQIINLSNIAEKTVAISFKNQKIQYRSTSVF